MKFATLRPTYSRKYATMSALSPNCRQYITTEHLTGATANSQEGARLDISANGLLGTYFDVRIFNPHAPLNKNMAPSACYKKHEWEKKRAYEQRVREIEHSSFTPLVLAATGGLGVEVTTFYKRLASKLYQKWYSPYSTTLPCVGYDAAWPFPSCVVQFRPSEVPSEVPGPPVGMPDPQVHRI